MTPGGPPELESNVSVTSSLLSVANVSVPLLIGGFFTIQRKVRGATDDSLAERLTFVGLLGISAAALLYLVAGVLDGIALAHAAERYHAASDELRFVNAEILMAIHETAVSFGGHFMAGALVSSGLFAAGLRRLPNRSPLPIVGIGIGVAGLLGMVAGVLDLSFQTNFPLLGGLVGLMMMWWLALAFSQFGRMREHAS